MSFAVGKSLTLTYKVSSIASPQLSPNPTPTLLEHYQNLHLRQSWGLSRNLSLFMSCNRSRNAVVKKVYRDSLEIPILISNAVVG
jgi:hypothetical protein